MICLTLIRQALDPSFPSFKTQRGWGFLHHSQVLLLVYCQDFTMVLLVWPCLASPRRTDLTLGRGVTDAQLYTSIQPPSACLTAFSCIMDSSVSMRNPEKSCKYLFFPGDHFIQCVQIFTLETRPIAETCVKDSSALTWPSSHLRKLVPRHHGHVCQMERCRTRENGEAGYSEWNTMLEAYQLSGCTKPNTSLWALAGNL